MVHTCVPSREKLRPRIASVGLEVKTKKDWGRGWAAEPCLACVTLRFNPQESKAGKLLGLPEFSYFTTNMTRSLKQAQVLGDDTGEGTGTQHSSTRQAPQLQPVRWDCCSQSGRMTGLVACVLGQDALSPASCSSAAELLPLRVEPLERGRSTVKTRAESRSAPQACSRVSARKGLEVGQRTAARFLQAVIAEARTGSITVK